MLESRPYNNITVEKIKCCNHILCNFCNKLSAVTTDTTYSLKLRKLLQSIFNECNVWSDCRKYLLRADIENIVNHVFGFQ